VLHQLGISLAAAEANGVTPAHWAAQNGHEGCLRVLHELGVSLAAAEANGATPPHFAAHNGHEGSLRVLHELGANLAAADANGRTPAHWAAGQGQEGCLRVLHQLGISLAAAASDGSTVAHQAAHLGHVACLRVLHECLRTSFEPIVAGLRGLPSDTASAMVRELEERMALAYVPSGRDGLATPAACIFASRGSATTDLHAKLECYGYLAEIGGTAKLVAWLSTNPSMLAADFAPLLTEPGLLDLKTKQTWLVWKLKAVVGNANAAQLMLVANRGNLLDGLCAQLGVDERTGHLTAGDGALARGVDVRRANTYCSMYNCWCSANRSAWVD
jgi:hypothetical protein